MILTADDEDAVLARLEDALSARPRVGDFATTPRDAKGMLTDRVLVTAAIALARAQRVPVIVDPKRREFSAYASADVIAKRQPAWSRLSAGEQPLLPKRRGAEAERRNRLDLGLTGSALLVTRLRKRHGPISRRELCRSTCPPTQNLVFDVSGAGDTVLATLACGLVGNLPIEQTMRLADLAAGIVVSKPGTATVTLDELRAGGRDP